MGDIEITGGRGVWRFPAGTDGGRPSLASSVFLSQSGECNLPSDQRGAPPRLFSDRIVRVRIRNR
jgi:hypothetical protein